MLNVILEILSILGILLLCFLGLAVLLILLVLFFPVSYKLSGKKVAEGMTVSARALWLFGLLRVRFDHPEPGRILVKIFPFTVFDSGRKTDDKIKKTSDSTEEKTKKRVGKEKRQPSDTEQEQTSGSSKAGADGGESDCTKKDDTPAENTEASDGPTDTRKEGEAGDDTDPLIFKKFKKIKYTICSIYDKIKNIWENISYYTELLQEEETKLLFSHVICRLGKILKSIRPRRIRGQILFGTGSPDTTGYVYGIYGMLSPFLGSGLAVTPDFAEAVLEGNLFLSGHITLFTILWNGLKILLDKKLRRFIKKMKAGRKR